MATLVLTTVGAVLGGPIGAAIGAAIGSQVDRVVFAPPGRQGPRLGDLTVQTSSYGAAIPRLFGTMRVAGTVIWATDLREDRHRSGTAKTGKTTTYSYSASFAVALSARPISSIGRIWADGNLLRGAAGDFKGETGFRLYTGDEDQAADPLIAAAEGIDAAPAHRGIAYAMFETMQLADYGNRIPSLTFEVVADDGAVPVATIARALSGGAILGDGGPALGGFAASGDSVRGALEALVQACPMPLADDGTALRIAADDTVAIPVAEFGATADGKPQPRRERSRQDGGALPDAVAVAYYEPARDYQSGLQRARRDGIGRAVTRVDLPAAVSAGTARAFAEDALTRAWIGREQAVARLPWRWLGARAGTRAMLAGDGPWRIAGWTLEHMALQLTLTREGIVPAGPSGANAGRAIASADAVAGRTVIVPLDLPALDDSLATAPRLYVAAAGTGAGWRRADVSLSLDGGASWTAAGQTALPATIGSAATVLGDGPTTLFDRDARIEVELLDPAMALIQADDDALVAGANLASLGDELIQFGDALQLTPTRWRLARLLRGRRGTDQATAGHLVGERFVLLEQATLLPLDVPLAALGATLEVMALGPGDEGVAVSATIPVVGHAVRPPAPVRLTAARLGDGTLHFGWVRRSRLGWAWLDGGDAALGEDAERYRLTITPSAGAVRTVELATPGYDYSPEEQASDGASGATRFAVRLAQLGTSAASSPAAAMSWTL